VLPDPTAPVDRSVDGPRTADGQPLGPAGQRQPPVGLDQEVNMVGLYGEMDDAKEGLDGRRHSTIESGEDAQ